MRIRRPRISLHLPAPPPHDAGAVSAVASTRPGAGEAPTRSATRETTGEASLSSRPRRLGAATIVGAGPAGLAQALLLLKRAPDTGLSRLTVVERRSEYTRPVSLFFRTLTLDALAWLDEEALRELERRSGMRADDGAPRGIVSERIDASGRATQRVVREAEDPSSRRFEERALDDSLPIADVADSLFRPASSCLITMKDLEEVLWEALPRVAKKQGVALDLRRGWEAEVVEQVREQAGGKAGETAGEKAAAEGPTAALILHELVRKEDGGERRLVRSGKKEALPHQGLVVLTEGAAARVRGRLGGHQVATGPSERILAAGLQGEATGTSIGRGGFATWTDEHGEDHRVRFMRGCHGENGLQWTVVGVPEGVEMDATDAAAHARDVDAWLHRYGSLAGDVDLPVVFGPALGEVKGTLVDQAVRGDNLVLCGDVVGTSHFSAGGGAATALTTHVVAMNRFLDDVAAGAPRQASLRRLDDDLRTASLTWALYALPEYAGDPWELRERFLPRKLLEELLPARLVERYWPASGGAPTDEQSPWTSWFDKARADAEATAALAAMDQALPPDARRAEAPVTASAWEQILAAAPAAAADVTAAAP